MGIRAELKKGRMPEQVREVADSECVDVEILKKGIIEGKIVIPKNKKRSNIKSVGIGYPLKTKVNANVGTSTDQANKDLEVCKAIAAEEAGADTVMDLSTGGNLSEIRK